MIKKVFMKVYSLFFSMQFLKFLTVGGIAALTNIVGGYLFRANFPGKFYYTISIGVGYVIGSIVSFILNKIFTFKAHDEKISHQMFKFCIPAILSIFIASFIANIIMTLYHTLDISWGTSDQMENIARVMSVGLTTLFNFPAMKFFSFKKISIGRVDQRIKQH